MAFTQQQTNMDSSLLTPAHFMSDERLDRAIKNVPPEIWDIIHTYKEKAETRDRLDRYKVWLVRINDGPKLRALTSWDPFRRCWMSEAKMTVLTAAQEEEAETDDMVRRLKNRTVAALKDECKKNGMQVSGGKLLLMIRIIAFRMYGKKLKGNWHALWSSLEHAPQKMWDAAVKCDWAATECQRRTASHEWLLQHYYSHPCLRFPVGRYYCGHQLPDLHPGN